MVTSADPAVWVSEIQDDGGQQIALRVPVTLRETSQAIYAWVPATDEQEVFGAAFSPVRPDFDAPANLTVASGAGISTEFNALLRIDFDPVAGADEYEVYVRIAGQAYALIATTTATSDIRYTAVVGQLYDVQVRAVARPVSGPIRYSDFAEVLGTAALPDGASVGIPTGGTATGGANEIAVSFTAPNSPYYTGMEFWGSNTDSSGAATLLTTLYGAAGTTKTHIETGLGNSVTRYYFAKSVDIFGGRSAFTASVTATTDP
jgi:hypothetical protein